MNTNFDLRVVNILHVCKYTNTHVTNGGQWATSSIGSQESSIFYLK